MSLLKYAQRAVTGVNPTKQMFTKTAANTLKKRAIAQATAFAFGEELVKHAKKMNPEVKEATIVADMLQKYAGKAPKSVDVGRLASEIRAILGSGQVPKGNLAREWTHLTGGTRKKNILKDLWEGMKLNSSNSMRGSASNPDTPGTYAMLKNRLNKYLDETAGGLNYNPSTMQGARPATELLPSDIKRAKEMLKTLAKENTPYANTAGKALTGLGGLGTGAYGISKLLDTGVFDPVLPVTTDDESDYNAMITSGVGGGLLGAGAGAGLEYLKNPNAEVEALAAKAVLGGLTGSIVGSLGGALYGGPEDTYLF